MKRYTQVSTVRLPQGTVAVHVHSRFRWTRGPTWIVRAIVGWLDLKVDVYIHPAEVRFAAGKAVELHSSTCTPPEN